VAHPDAVAHLVQEAGLGLRGFGFHTQTTAVRQPR